MKTVLLLTGSNETKRLLAEILGQHATFVTPPPPAESRREPFDALFATWRRLVDAVVLDAASLGETTPWALESLAGARLLESQAVVVRVNALQRSLYATAPGWLVVTDTEQPGQLKQTLLTFFQLREAQARIKQADAVIARQRQAATAQKPVAFAPPAADSYRYRDALKNLSRLLGQTRPPGDEQALLTDFLRLIRELLGAGRLAIFKRPWQSDWFGQPPAPASAPLTIAASAGIAPEVAGHMALTLESGIAGQLAREARILHRAGLADSAGLELDAQIAREFELLGTEVAVPMFDNDQLLGLLTFSGKVTGESVTAEELELVYHLMSQLAQALRNWHLLGQMSRQQQLWSEVLANVQSGVIVVGPDSTVLSLNPRARQLLDLGSQEIAGHKLHRLPSRVADIVFETLENGCEVRQREVTLPRGRRILGVSATRFAAGALAGNGEFVAVALVDDLTEAKLEQARARELADKEFFTRLAARLSHELKNSVTSIKIFAQLLPERYNEQDFREQFSATVANEVNRMDVLVNNLTFFAHPLALVYEEVGLTDIVDTCVGNVTQEFARKGLAHVVAVSEKLPSAPTAPVVTVKRNFAHKCARMEADRIRLMQAIEHVLRNAVQSMPKGGRLTISTADAQPSDFDGGRPPAGGGVRIEIADSGEGISLENLKRVTEPFITTRNVGVGLGLTIVRKIVERHGGRLALDSLLGRGTTVTIVLPVKAQPHPEEALLLAAEEGAAETEAGKGEHHGGRISTSPDAHPRVGS
jgi:signal transduction histidine kinase